MTVLSGVAACGNQPATEAVPVTTTPSGAELARARAVLIVQRLRESGLPVRDVAACRPPAPAPPGHPRPDAAAFDDARITARVTGVRVVARGGVVEVHGSARQVTQRLRELDEQSRIAGEYGFDEGGRPLAAERRYRAGGALLRLSGDLSVRQSHAYVAALRRAVEASADPSVTTDIEEAPCST